MKETKKINQNEISISNGKTKILSEFIYSLQLQCIMGEVDYRGLADDLLKLQQNELTKYYSPHDILLQDLKTSLERLKKWKEVDYNRKLALFICQNLYQRDQSQSKQKKSMIY
ncbi:MAG: hypothetical protein I3273_00110 [Candidatus Moeniiplasma glomeromycotorum]|nr:hypothetical protein [Candidatus Moeniiplasma glomeromycotorum]MCE8167467.1 hypothetical protein [Candidatus Moeniiplasma glomeromycotorum]MCE8168519.1 hypothetical protein [Candidatus Moeniiplasma glomeromycotorum]